MRQLPSSPTVTIWRVLREMPKSRSTIWHSGERPITTSPEANEYVCGLSPS